MANQHIFNNTLIITGSVTASDGFYGDGSGLTGITATAEWDGSRDGDASITGSFVVSGSSVNVDFTNTTGVSGSFSGSYSGDGSGLTNLNINGLQASGSTLSGSFSGSFEGDGSGLTNLNPFPYNGDIVITGSLTISGSDVTIDLTNTSAISGSIFSGSFVGDGSGITNLPTSEWDGTRNGDAEITGSFIVSGSTPTIQLLGDTTIDENIVISNRNQTNDLAIGFEAIPNSTVARRTLAIGCRAGYFQTSGSCNLLVGSCAGAGGEKTACNLAIGHDALRSNTGLDTGGVTTISSNVAVGNQALFSATTAYYSVAIGHRALYSTTTGQGNVAVGFCAGASSTGYSNVLIGQQAGRQVGAFNTIIGHQASLSGTGCRNSFVGYQSGQCIDGRDNIAFGYYSGKKVIGNSCRNVYLGTNTGPSTSTTQNDQLYIGNKDGETPLLRGDFATGQLTINTQVSASVFSGSFVGDGSGLTNVSGSGFPYTGTARITGSLIVSQSAAANTAVTFETGHIILTQVSASLNYDSDIEAAAGGVPLGGLYRSGNSVQIRIT